MTAKAPKSAAAGPRTARRLRTGIIHNRECVRGMRELIPDSSVDLVVTDPPFGIGFGAEGRCSSYNRDKSLVVGGYADVGADGYREFTLAWMREAYRALKDTGSMYVFSGWNRLKDVLAALDDTGFETINHIVWKYQFGVATRTKYVTSHYTIPYVCKDPSKRRFYPHARFAQGEKGADGGSLHYRDKEDVWAIKREYWRGREKTPTKLPLEIVRKMLAYSSVRGDVVLDPFMGSGQVAVAAKEAERRYVGFEVVPAYCRLARRRVGAAAAGYSR